MQEHLPILFLLNQVKIVGWSLNILFRTLNQTPFKCTGGVANALSKNYVVKSGLNVMELDMSNLAVRAADLDLTLL